MGLRERIGAAPTWALGTADGNPVVGPLATFDAVVPDLTVTVIDPGDVPVGVARSTVRVSENAQQFEVTYHDFAGCRGLYHHHGRNWVLWTTDLRHVFVSRGPETWTRTWVYARFLLRHFIVARLLQRPGYRRFHAVAGTLTPGETSPMTPAGLLIAGPYLSGKTYLLDHLIATGVVADSVEDDCAVISPDWELHALLPVEHEFRTMRRLPIRAMICLDREATAAAVITPQQAVHWIFPIQASWPLWWLPGAGVIETTVGPLPEQLSCLRLPERPPLDRAASSIKQLLRNEAVGNTRE